MKGGLSAIVFVVLAKGAKVRNSPVSDAMAHPMTNRMSSPRLLSAEDRLVSERLITMESPDRRALRVQIVCNQVEPIPPDLLSKCLRPPLPKVMRET